MQPADEKTSKTFKLFILLEKFLVCLFPINIRDFKPKKRFWPKTKQKIVEKQTKSKKIKKTDKVKNFV